MHMDLKTIQRPAQFVGGISGFLGVLLVAGFSVGGTEVVAVTAGESDDPKNCMPKAIKQVFWRILFYYAYQFDNPYSVTYRCVMLKTTEFNWLKPINMYWMSSLTLTSVIDAVILTSLLSAANSGVYTTRRCCIP